MVFLSTYVLHVLCFLFFFPMQCHCPLHWCVMDIKGSIDLFLEIRIQTLPKHWRSSSTLVHCSAWCWNSDLRLDHPWSQSTTLSRNSTIFFILISSSTDNELWREPGSMECNNLRSWSPDEQWKHEKWKTTVLLISTNPHLSSCFLLSLYHESSNIWCLGTPCVILFPSHFCPFLMQCIHISPESTQEPWPKWLSFLPRASESQEERFVQGLGSLSWLALQQF